MLVAIDPDIDKSGVAILDKGKLTACNYDFIELTKFLEENKQRIVLCIIEASWLNHHNWTSNKTKINPATLRIANHTGANHQVGKLIEKYARHYNIRCKLQKPLIKHWKGPDRKITHDEIVKLTFTKKYGYTATKSNQEQRDAILLLASCQN